MRVFSIILLKRVGEYLYLAGIKCQILSVKTYCGTRIQITETHCVVIFYFYFLYCKWKITDSMFISLASSPTDVLPDV